VSEILSHELPKYLAERRSARRGERLVQIIAGAVAALLLAGSALFVEPLNEIRTRAQMTTDAATIKGLPPLESLLAKTGTFRALAIDIAFIRLERLKEEGKFYELMQLASWICRLAPQFPSVWSYHAWNQAYNISVATYTPEERWHWVNNGIHLLRDEGIPLNPRSVTLYKELAWIYWHKIGDFLDDYHWSYKKELAVEMELVLGAPPVFATEKEVVDGFRSIVDAPRNLDRILTDDAEVAEFVRRLAEVELSPNRELLAFVARYLRDDLSVQRFLKSQPEGEAPTLQARRVALLSDPAYAAPRQRLVAALRSKVLREDYHMNLEWMLDLMEHYGPLDWRSPYTHCLYWAGWGDMTTRGVLDLNPNDSMNTARYIMFALDNMVKRGKIVLTPDFETPNESFLQLLPDVRFVDHYHTTVIELSKVQFPDSPETKRGEPAENYRGGYFNMMSFAIQQLYFDGNPKNQAKAEEYYKYVRDINRNPDGSVKQMYLVPLQEYVMADIKEAATGFKSANMLINALIYRSLWQLGMENAPQSVAIMEEARKVYAYYMSDKWGDPQDRRKLGKLIVLRADGVEAFLSDPGIPITQKIRMWKGIDERTRQMVWDRIEPFLVELCNNNDPPLDRSKAFPEPPGMAEYRQNPEVVPQEAPSDVSEGTKF